MGNVTDISKKVKYLAADTMSSLEIAKLTGKQHKNVMRDIRTMLNELEGARLNIEPGSEDLEGARSKDGPCSEDLEIARSNVVLDTYLDENNRKRNCYNLPRFECDLLISGYSVIYRAAIINRWYELEAARNSPEAVEERLQWDIQRGMSISNYHDMVEMTHEKLGTTNFHVVKECQNVNCAVLGMSAREYRLEYNIPENESIRDYMSPYTLRQIQKAEGANTMFINMGLSRDKREELLGEQFGPKSLLLGVK